MTKTSVPRYSYIDIGVIFMELLLCLLCLFLALHSAYLLIVPALTYVRREERFRSDTAKELPYPEGALTDGEFTYLYQVITD